MTDAESSLWWYRALHERVVAALINSFSGRRDIAILDVGCGTGGTMQTLIRSGYLNVCGIDLSEHAIRACRERGLNVQLGDMREAVKAVPAASLDVIILNDVIYFVPIERWPDILSSYREALKPGGIVIINAPALSAFRGMHDVAVGIKKRFNPRDLSRLLHPNHFQIEVRRFWPVLLSPLIYLTRLWQRVKLGFSPNMQIESDVSVPSRWVNNLMLAITRMEAKLPWVPGWASSLFVVLRVKKGAQ